MAVSVWRLCFFPPSCRRKTLRSLHKRLSAIEQDSPQLVAQVAFTEWTRDGKLRHPRYLGLRTHKAPDEVVRETR